MKFSNCSVKKSISLCVRDMQIVVLTVFKKGAHFLMSKFLIPEVFLLPFPRLLKRHPSELIVIRCKKNYILETFEKTINALASPLAN